MPHLYDDHDIIHYYKRFSSKSNSSWCIFSLGIKATDHLLTADFLWLLSPLVEERNKPDWFTLPPNFYSSLDFFSCNYGSPKYPLTTNMYRLMASPFFVFTDGLTICRIFKLHEYRKYKCDIFSWYCITNLYYIQLSILIDCSSNLDCYTYIMFSYSLCPQLSYYL